NAELERYNDQVDYYLLCKPGMTGLWQVSGRSDVDYDTRVYLDSYLMFSLTFYNHPISLNKKSGYQPILLYFFSA
ncbi:sugar transferase, partial [Klebsiella pneumoniae]